MPSRLPTLVVPDSTWPAYRLPAASKLASALQEGARRSLGRSLPLTVAGPYEAIEVASIPKVYEAYRAAVRQLLLDDQGL
jgi:hypothetical protein